MMPEFSSEESEFLMEIMRRLMRARQQLQIAGLQNQIHSFNIFVAQDVWDMLRKLAEKQNKAAGNETPLPDGQVGQIMGKPLNLDATLPEGSIRMRYEVEA